LKIFIVRDGFTPGVHPLALARGVLSFMIKKKILETK
jgi:hypothetical protein